ncbi:MAG TPA: hypothetical protein PLA50_01980 [Bacteroidia bacterium]|nr:hypothetical protein [Bacteroidia bacterium]
MITLLERARRYVAAMPPAISGSGGHDATFAAACALIKGFGLSVSEARPLLAEYNGRCDSPWSERELEHKLQQADKTQDPQPRGYLVGKGKIERGSGGEGSVSEPRTDYRPPRPKPQYDERRLREFAGEWAKEVDLLWLANRSTVDPAMVTTEDFLGMLYGSREKVLAFSQVNGKGVPWTQGEAIWPDEEPPSTGRCGVWFLAQPVSGEFVPNPRTGKESRRSEESVLRWPFLVLESDDAPLREWMGALARLPLRIAAIYTSGGRSVHALVRVDAVTKPHWDDLVKRQMQPGLKFLILNGADPGVFSAVRLTRLPGAFREGKMKEGRWLRFPRPELQKLLYVNPTPVARPLCEIPPQRDVEEEWCGRPATESDEETVGALGYYARVSARCRERLEDLRRER